MQRIDEEDKGKMLCFTCLGIVRYYTGLRRHQKYECGMERQFQCPHCPYKARQKIHLKNHIGLKHLNLCSEEKL
ncbi:unnamed protein product [Nezara viridula]|uniref:C2H2-type domain-containing protein n=1 Tax=Nezara viridula TaxID=85310 RepID=A0A9P0HCU0_NEZVI|nr:unnamed protein product [Nezara viridula]